MNENLPLCYVVSSSNLFSRTLVDKLKKENCEVVLISNENDFYKYIQQSTFKPDYLFYVEGFNEKFFLNFSKFKNLLDFITSYKPKVQFVFPYCVNGKRARVERIAKSSILSKINVCYLGDVYGVGMELNGSFISKFFKAIYEEREVNVPSFDFDIYIVSAEKAVNTLLRGFFSYGFGKREFVIAKKISFFKFLRDIKRYAPHLVYVQSVVKPVSTISNFDLVSVREKQDFEATVKWVLSNKRPKKKVKLRIRKVGYLKNIKLLSIILFWILAIPFFLFFISVIFLKQGFHSLNVNDFRGAKIYFGVSKTASSFSSMSFSFWDGPRRVSRIIWSFADVGEGSIDSLTNLQNITGQISGDQPYDLTSESSQLYLSLDDLYKRLSLLEADKNDFKDLNVFLPSEFDVEKINNLLPGLKRIASDLPALLGVDKQKTYLLLLQDSQELRATGGKIGSFGVFTFDKGRLVSKNFYSSKDVDGQLKGYTAPPVPLQKYVGINNWGLGNSNWDADFKNSSIKAEWFLKNEVGIDASGVIGVDSETYKKLEDIGDNFLQGVSTLFTNFESKNIQVYLNSNEDEEQISNLNWGGEIRNITCEGNCLSIPTGIIEDNLGGNNINADINRYETVNVDLTGENIIVNTTVSITNSSKETYKAYFRELGPKNANFNYADGVYAEVPSMGSKDIVLSWNSSNDIDFTKSGKVNFNFRKQAGASGILKLNFKLPSNLTGRVTSSYNTNLEKDFSTILTF